MMRREVGEKGSLHQSQNAQEDVDIFVVVYICCHLGKAIRFTLRNRDFWNMKSCSEQPIRALSNIQPASHLQTNWNLVIACITSTTMIKHVAGKCISRSQQLQLLLMQLPTGVPIGGYLPFLNVRQEREGLSLKYLLMMIILLHTYAHRSLAEIGFLRNSPWCCRC